MNKIGSILIGLLIIGIGILGIWYVFLAPKQPSEVSDATLPIDTTLPPIEEMPLPSLIGTNWMVSNLDNQPLVPGSAIFATFGQDGRVTGNDGCNNFSGAYTVSGTQLTIDPNLISTKMACEPAIDQQATVFTNALLSTTNYELVGAMMLLYQGETAGITMLDQGNSLAKTSWSVTAYNNGNQAVVGTLAGTNLTMTFGDDGTISGNSGCNSFSGQYYFLNDSITISEIGMTLKACETPEGVMDQEAAFLAALQSAATWQMQGMELSMRTADDALAIMAVRNDL